MLCQWTHKLKKVYKKVLNRLGKWRGEGAVGQKFTGNQRRPLVYRPKKVGERGESCPGCLGRIMTGEHENINQHCTGTGEHENISSTGTAQVQGNMRTSHQQVLHRYRRTLKHHINRYCQSRITLGKHENITSTATVISTCWATVDWSWPTEWN